jgi:hypothetical protein
MATRSCASLRALFFIKTDDIAAVLDPDFLDLELFSSGAGSLALVRSGTLTCDLRGPKFNKT